MYNTPSKFVNRNGHDCLVDVFSICFSRRELSIFRDITLDTAAVVNACLRCLAYDSNEPITIYISGPGGDVAAGFSIYDTCKATGCEIRTVACGTTASMAAFLVCCAGTKGSRYIQPNAEMLIHQPLGGFQGQASDIRIHAEHVLKTKDKLNSCWAKATDRSLKQIERDTDRDYILTAEDAVAYGLVDRIEDPISEWQEERS